MTPFWVNIDGARRVAIVPRPRGGDWLEDELRAIRQANVNVLVSMLTSEERTELGLQREAALSSKIGLDFRSFPICDRETPTSVVEMRRFVTQLRREMDEGKTVATHCRASIGRSSLVLACLLVDEGWGVEEAFAQLSASRGTRVPDTEAQVQWVERYAEANGWQAEL